MLTIGTNIYIQFIAMFCNLGLFTVLLVAKKNAVINRLLFLMGALTIWSAGNSFATMTDGRQFTMLQEISMIAILMTPAFTYHLMSAFIGVKHSGWSKQIRFITTILVLTSPLHMFIEKPDLLQLESGVRHINYHLDARAFLPIGLIFYIIALTICLLWKAVQEEEVSIQAIRPFLVGIPILLIGNLISLLPGLVLPWDVVSSLVFSIIIFYTLCKKRAIQMYSMVYKRVFFMGAAGGISLLLLSLLLPVQRYLVKTNYMTSDRMYLSVLMCFLILAAIIYIILQYISLGVFLQSKDKQIEILQEVGKKLTEEVEVTRQLEILGESIQQTIPMTQVWRYCYQDSAYELVKSEGIGDSSSYRLAQDHPLVTYFESVDQNLVLGDCSLHMKNKLQPHDGKNILRDLKPDVIIPIKVEQKVRGLLLVKREVQFAYSYHELTFLDSIRLVGEIAIKNTMLHQKHHQNARRDYLTGLWNRTTFMEVLQTAVVNRGSNVLTLAMLNIDDFKLYNQLYGNNHGDRALKEVAEMLKDVIGERGWVARYGAKEFAVLVPEMYTKDMEVKVMEMQKQMQLLTCTKNSEKLNPLTFSAGICTIPFHATTGEELLDHVDMTVCLAKKAGKNRIGIYEEDNTQFQLLELGMINPQESDLLQDNETIRALAATIDAKDSFTYSHSNKVAEYAILLAKKIGLSVEHQRAVYEAGLLHDVGKIAIPESILCKPGRLTAEEYEIIKTHVKSSIDIVKHLPTLEYIIPAIVSHHERWDGQGYPRGVAAKEVPIAGRCLAIADSFDAMTAQRVYRKPFTLEYAKKELYTQAGKQFDPELVEAFLELIEEGKIVL